MQLRLEQRASVMREPAFWWRPGSGSLLKPARRHLRRDRGFAHAGARSQRRRPGYLSRQSHRRRRRQDAGGTRRGASSSRRARTAILFEPRLRRTNAGAVTRGPSRPFGRRRRRRAASARAACPDDGGRDRSKGRGRSPWRRNRHRDGRRLPKSGAGQGTGDPDGRWPPRHRQRTHAFRRGRCVRRWRRRWRVHRRWF